MKFHFIKEHKLEQTLLNTSRNYVGRKDALYTIIVLLVYNKYIFTYEFAE